MKVTIRDAFGQSIVCYGGGDMKVEFETHDGITTTIDLRQSDGGKRLASKLHLGADQIRYVIQPVKR